MYRQVLLSALSETSYIGSKALALAEDNSIVYSALVGLLSYRA